MDDQGTVIWQSNGDYGSGASKTFGYQVITLGTNDIQTIGAVIYPNPAQNTVNIAGAEQASITVYDVLGRMVWSQTQADNLVEMDVTSFSAGTYFVRLTKGNQTQTEKLVITR